jgi:hypothetical protein
VRLNDFRLPWNPGKDVTIPKNRRRRNYSLLFPWKLLMKALGMACRPSFEMRNLTEDMSAGMDSDFDFDS